MWRKAALVFGPLASMFVLATIARVSGWKSEPDKDDKPPAVEHAKDPPAQDENDEDQEDGDLHASVELSDLSSFVFSDEGKRVVIAGNNATGRRHCEAKARVWIAGNNNQLELDGDCGQIQVTGNNNDLKADQAEHIKLTGNNNELGVGTTDSVAMMGNDNTVRYRADNDGGAPKLSQTGRNNRMIKDDSDVDVAN